MKNTMLSIMAWAQNATAKGEEGAVGDYNGLLITILIVIAIFIGLFWLYFNVGVNEK